MKNYVRNPNCNCKVCGKEIYRRPFQIKKGNVFCGQKCYIEDSIIWKFCPICNAKFKSGLNKTHCSKACANKLKIGTKYKIGPKKRQSNYTKIIKKKTSGNTRNLL